MIAVFLGNCDHIKTRSVIPALAGFQGRLWAGHATVLSSPCLALAAHVCTSKQHACYKGPHFKIIARDYNKTHTFQGCITAQQRDIQLLIIPNDMLHLRNST